MNFPEGAALSIWELPMDCGSGALKFFARHNLTGHDWGYLLSQRELFR